MKRPWQGQVEHSAAVALPAHDPKCYLCPGNARAGGARNPDYSATYVFENDFAALLPGSPQGSYDQGGLLRAESERGVCRVICFSPRHDLTLARMERTAIRRVIDVWADESAGLARDERIAYVQIFENRGEMMGCSNPHPHCQVWANETTPNEVAKEADRQERYFAERGRALLDDYLAIELRRRERIVCENDEFCAVVPFWALWPFETMLLVKRPAETVESLDETARDGLADILKRLTSKYDNLFETPFPYSMGFHQRPCNGQADAGWRLHAHFYPPLLRSATVRKFMVGYELLGAPQRDLTPEKAAERLCELAETHYLEA